MESMSIQTIFNNQPGDPPCECWGFSTVDYPQWMRDLVMPFINGEVWSLFIHGPNGTGKSCFAAALLQYWRLKHPYEQGVWFDCDVLEKSMMDFDSWPSILNSYIRRPFIVLDDLGSKPARSENKYKPGEYFSLLIARKRAKLPTIITTNKTLAQIAEYIDPSLSSRLQSGIILKIDGKDRRSTN
jgi:DNA replication protein DnaC